MIKTANNYLFLGLLAISILTFSNYSFADDYPLKEKLLQCQAAFNQMHSGDLSQDEAWKLRLKHKKLVVEILHSLNKHNHDILKSGDLTMTSEQILDNFIAMGSLLEMMATENARMTDEWGYPLE